MTNKRGVQIAVRGAAVLGALALSGAALAACGSNDKSGGDSTATGNTQVLNITLSNKGCAPPKSEIPAGPTKFQIKNSGGTKVTEVELMQGGRILAEKENLADSFSGSFTLNLKPGDYELYCPGAETERSPLKVTGEAASSSGSEAEQAALTKAISDYRAYVQDEVNQLVTNTTAVQEAIDDGDVARAKKLYEPARLNYERIEPVAESFGDLDPRIDGRAEDFDSPEDFQGFHRIEMALWQDNTTDGMSPIAAKLVADTESLKKLVATLDIDAAQIANGATELMNEVANSKVSGEEERYSHLDILDMAGNIQGSEKAFTLLQPALEMTNKALATTVAQRFAEMNAAMEPYEAGDSYVLYNTLTADQVRELSRAVGALAEPLSEVAGAIVGKA
jgi:iron uptake system component EfeO